MNIKKTLLIIFAICQWSIIIIIASIYIWINNYSWRIFSTKEEMEFNGQQLNNTKDFPELFYKVYDKVRPNQRKITMSQQTIYELISPNKSANKDCKCDEIAFLVWSNKNLNLKFEHQSPILRFGYGRFGYGLQKYSSPEKCFDYYINNNIIWNDEYLESLNELSILVNNKQIEELDEDQILYLIAWYEMLRHSITDTVQINVRYNLLKNKYEQ